MKQVNPIKALMMCCFLATGINSNAQALKVNESISPYQAVELARQEFPNMLQLIDPSDMKAYGFDMRDNFSNIEIGKPFYVVSLPITPSLSNDETVSANPSTIMLPVLLDGSARCMLFVSQEEGNWKVVGIGEGNFVKTHQEIFNGTEEQSAVIVNVPQLSQEYLLVQDKEISFKPLLQFDQADNMESVSFNQLIAINTKAIEANKENSSNENQPINSK